MVENDPFDKQFFSRLQKFRIRTRRNFLGSRQGVHTSNRKGHGIEFSDYRSYTPGDDFRHIDWGLYGRSDRLYVRQFREEQDLSLSVLLDASGSMAQPAAKYNFATNLAISLAYVALMSGDSVNIYPLGAEPLPTYRHAKAIQPAMSKLRALTPSGELDLARQIGAALERQREAGKCFLISDCFYPRETLFAALDKIRLRNFELAILQIVSPFELDPDLIKDCELVDQETGAQLEMDWDTQKSREYERAFSEHLEQIQVYCNRYGIEHSLLSCDEDLRSVVLNKFPLSGLLK